jgi:hypothetical protein
MISKIHLHQIGPVADLEAEFGPRLNLITGDNGLGKTFLLDACWFALTRTWAGGKSLYPTPDVPKKDPPHIDYTVSTRSQPGIRESRSANYHFANQEWRSSKKPFARPGLVVYVRVDGGFSVWDPARNGWWDHELNLAEHTPDRPPAFQFSNNQVWEGMEEDPEGRKKTICNGLLRDVETWRLKGNGAFKLLQNVLKGISSGGEETLSIGQSVRVRIDDARDIPTLKMPYGLVPVTQAAAGMRRVLALAYMLVWTWDEHCRVSELEKEEPSSSIVLLFDEVDAHLHPQWQRVFLPSLLEAVSSLLRNRQPGVSVDEIQAQPYPKAKSTPNEGKLLTTNYDMLREDYAEGESLPQEANPQSVQIIATTHAPLVLASIETRFDDVTDKLFLFDLHGHEVQFNSIPWAKRGDASAWLRSPSLGLVQARSKEAEEAIEVAQRWMSNDRQNLPSHLNSEDKIHNRLVEVLGEFDDFWPRWIVKREGQK